MKLTIIKDFTYWHGGCRRADYAAGQEVDANDQEMIAVAMAEGWAVAADKDESPKRGRKPSTLKGGPISPAAEAE